MGGRTDEEVCVFSDQGQKAGRWNETLEILTRKGKQGALSSNHKSFFFLNYGKTCSQNLFVDKKYEGL